MTRRTPMETALGFVGVVLTTTSLCATAAGDERWQAKSSDVGPFTLSSVEMAHAGPVDLTPRVSIQAMEQVDLGGLDPSRAASTTAGLRMDLSGKSWRSLHLIASLGYLHESPAPWLNNAAWLQGSGGPAMWGWGQGAGGDGARVQLALSGDAGRVRMMMGVQGQRVFAQARDTLDVAIQARATYRVSGALLAGIEYVGEELEEALDPGADGGGRHFAGPTASVQLLHDKLTLTGGPAIGLSEDSRRVLARLALTYEF